MEGEGPYRHVVCKVEHFFLVTIVTLIFNRIFNMLLKLSLYVKYLPLIRTIFCTNLLLVIYNERLLKSPLNLSL